MEPKLPSRFALRFYLLAKMSSFLPDLQAEIESEGERVNLNFFIPSQVRRLLRKFHPRHLPLLQGVFVGPGIRSASLIESKTRGWS